MRVVWNLVSGLDEKGLSQIRTVDTMLTAIEFINKGDLDCLEVYKSLEKLDLNNTKSQKNSFYARCQEECLKAKLISDDSGWENKFIDKEPKYRGSIRFLLLDAYGNSTNMETFNRKADKNILEDKNFYTNLIKHCTSTDQLKEIVYEEDYNSLVFGEYDIILKYKNIDEKIAAIGRKIRFFCLPLHKINDRVDNASCIS